MTTSTMLSDDFTFPVFLGPRDRKPTRCLSVRGYNIKYSSESQSSDKSIKKIPTSKNAKLKLKKGCILDGTEDWSELLKVRPKFEYSEIEIPSFRTDKFLSQITRKINHNEVIDVDYDLTKVNKRIEKDEKPPKKTRVNFAKKAIVRFFGTGSKPKSKDGDVTESTKDILLKSILKSRENPNYQQEKQGISQADQMSMALFLASSNARSIARGMAGNKEIRSQTRQRQVLTYYENNDTSNDS